MKDLHDTVAVCMTRITTQKQLKAGLYYWLEAFVSDFISLRQMKKEVVWYKTLFDSNTHIQQTLQRKWGFSSQYSTSSTFSKTSNCHPSWTESPTIRNNSSRVEPSNEWLLYIRKLVSTRVALVGFRRNLERNSIPYLPSPEKRLNRTFIVVVVPETACFIQFPRWTVLFLFREVSIRFLLAPPADERDQ